MEEKFINDQWRVVFLAVAKGFDEYALDSMCEEVSNILYCVYPEPFRNRLIAFIYKVCSYIHFHFGIRMPFKNMWLKRFLPQKVENELSRTDRICFVFTRGVFDLQKEGLIDYIKRRYPYCKLAYEFTDTVESYVKCYKDFSVERLAGLVDLIITYNEKDADESRVFLSPPILYKSKLVDKKTEYDVIYVGNNKGRLKQLIQIYDGLVEKGITCKMYISEVCEDEMISRPGIEYNHKLSYGEVLDCDLKAKAIINILQPGADGITLRDYEAISMNKLLITNRTNLGNTDIYDPNKVIRLSELMDATDKIRLYSTEKQWNVNSRFTPKAWYKWFSSKLDEMN